MTRKEICTYERGGSDMSEFLAQFISCCIATAIDERLKGKYCLSSYEYELLEQNLQKGKFDDIEKWIMKITEAL